MPIFPAAPVSLDRTNHELVNKCDTWNQDGYVEWSFEACDTACDRN